MHFDSKEKGYSLKEPKVGIKPTSKEIQSKFVLLGLSIVNLCLTIWGLR